MTADDTWHTMMTHEVNFLWWCWGCSGRKMVLTRQHRVLCWYRRGWEHRENLQCSVGQVGAFQGSCMKGWCKWVYERRWGGVGQGLISISNMCVYALYVYAKYVYVKWTLSGLKVKNYSYFLNFSDVHFKPVKVDAPQHFTNFTDRVFSLSVSN